MEYSMGAGVNDSECSSGCDSGWTLYLDNSFVSPYDNGNGNGKCGFSYEKRRTEEDEEEEDMSMVSDASSGPPHFPEEEDYPNEDCNKCLYHAQIDATLSKNRVKKQKLRENKRRNEALEKSSLLDDTASSPVFNLPNKNFEAEALLDVSKGYSTTQFKGSSAYQQPYGFFQYSSSPSGNNYLQQNQLSFFEFIQKSYKSHNFYLAILIDSCGFVHDFFTTIQVVGRQNVAAVTCNNHIHQFAADHDAVVVVVGGG